MEVVGIDSGNAAEDIASPESTLIMALDLNLQMTLCSTSIDGKLACATERKTT